MWSGRRWDWEAQPGRRERLGIQTRLFPFLIGFWVFFHVPAHQNPCPCLSPGFPSENNTGVCCPSPQSSCWASWLCCDRVKSINPCKFLIVARVVLSLVVDLGLFLDWKKDFGRKSSSDRGPMYQLVLDELRDPVL